MSNLLKQLSEIEKEAIVEMRTGHTTKELQAKLVEADKSMGLVEKAQKEEGTVLDIFGMTQAKLGIDAPADAIQIKALDFFGRAILQWTHDGRLATVGVNASVTIAVVFPQDDRAELAEELREKYYDAGVQPPAMERAYQAVSGFQVFLLDKANPTPQRLGVFSDWESASQLASEKADQLANPVLANKASTWRNQPASPNQIALATRLETYKEGMNRGQVAQAITHGLAIKKLSDAKIVKWGS